MGLTSRSTGIAAADAALFAMAMPDADLTVALAGNPNVGKSTVFNALTGMRQHTGNWPGKTVACAAGVCRRGETSLAFVDLPGTYSLHAHSAEEEAARDYLCFGRPDAVVVVCDATCLERNLNLVLQCIEITPRVVVCVNLMDEARKKRIVVDLDALSRALGVPVVGASARSGEGLTALLDAVLSVVKALPKPPDVRYPAAFEAALARLLPVLSGRALAGVRPRKAACLLLEGADGVVDRLCDADGAPLAGDPAVSEALAGARTLLANAGLQGDRLADAVTAGLVGASERIAAKCVRLHDPACHERDRRLDRILTSRATGIPIMLLLLGLVFFLTVSGANVPSALLSSALFSLEAPLLRLLLSIGLPVFLADALSAGVYRVLAWVISVMLPPMAIFFPLFTLLEDFGYLPRVAFNLDKTFHRCSACGKQALTMWMVDRRMRGNGAERMIYMVAPIHFAGRRHRVDGDADHNEISIRTPAWGVTLPRREWKSKTGNFNPHARMGRDSVSKASRRCHSRFARGNGWQANKDVCH